MVTCLKVSEQLKEFGISYNPAVEFSSKSAFHIEEQELKRAVNSGLDVLSNFASNFPLSCRSKQLAKIELQWNFDFLEQVVNVFIYRMNALARPANVQHLQNYLVTKYGKSDLIATSLWSSQIAVVTTTAEPIVISGYFKDVKLEQASYGIPVSQIPKEVIAEGIRTQFIKAAVVEFGLLRVFLDRTAYYVYNPTFPKWDEPLALNINTTLVHLGERNEVHLEILFKGIFQLEFKKSPNLMYTLPFMHCAEVVRTDMRCEELSEPISKLQKFWEEKHGYYAFEDASHSFVVVSHYGREYTYPRGYVTPYPLKTVDVNEETVGPVREHLGLLLVQVRKKILASYSSLLRNASISMIEEVEILSFTRRALASYKCLDIFDESLDNEFNDLLQELGIENSQLRHALDSQNDVETCQQDAACIDVGVTADASQPVLDTSRELSQSTLSGASEVRDVHKQALPRNSKSGQASSTDKPSPKSVARKRRIAISHNDMPVIEGNGGKPVKKRRVSRKDLPIDN